MKKLALFIFTVLFLEIINVNAQWVEQDMKVPIGNHTRSISIVNSNVVYAATNNSNLFAKTTNGGTAWDTMRVTGVPSQYRFSNIYALDANNIWACFYNNSLNNQGDVYKSTNGGTSWVKQTNTEYKSATSFPNIVYFFDASNGLIMGDTEGTTLELYSTSNGGSTWSRVNSPNIPDAVAGEAGVVDYYEVKGDTVWYPTQEGRVFISYDKGVNWIVDTISNNLCDIAMKTNLVGMANSNGSIYSTTDGGRNWSLISNVGSAYSRIDILEGKYVCYGSSGMKFSDDGINWIQLDNDNHNSFESLGNSNVAWTGNTNDGSGNYLGIAKYETGFLNEIFTIDLQTKPTCGGDSFVVNINNPTTFNSDNVFQIQMDFSEDFSSNPTIVGEFSGTSTSSIKCKALTYDWWTDDLVGKYYFRVVSSSPRRLSEFDTSTFVGSIPENIGEITGPAGKICVGAQGETFSTTATFQAESYEWFKPVGSETSIPSSTTLDFDESTNDGYVTVEAVNSCGNGIVEVDSIYINSPFSIQHDVGAGYKWGGSIYEPLTADVIRVQDQSSSYEGCDVFAPGTFDGKIAMIDRGTCNFTTKAFNAQQAGAVGVIIRVPSDYGSKFDYENNSYMTPGNMAAWVDIPSVIINDSSTVSGTDSLVQLVNTGNMNITFIPESYKLNFHPEVVADAGADQSICGVGSAQLNATGGNTYSWSPNINLSATNISNPTANPSSDQTYYVTVTNTTSGCSDLDSVTVFKPSASTPVASFTVVVDTVARTATFTNTSTGADSYDWDFGDGNTSTYHNPIHTYSADGDYTVKLTAKSACAAADGSTQTVINIYNDCSGTGANAGSDVTICNGNSTQLNASGGGTYSWSPNVGLSSTTVANPVANPTTTISYVVTVNNASSGCTDKDTVVVTVQNSTTPVAAFVLDIDTANLTITITNNSIDADSYIWSFGDGNTSTDAEPTYTYSSAGEYTIKLTAKSNCSSNDGTFEKTINLEPDGIINEELSNVIAYPNPSTGLLYVESSNLLISEIRIKNLIGESILVEERTQNGIVKVDLKNFPNGIYFLEIYGDDFSKLIKVVKE